MNYPLLNEAAQQGSNRVTADISVVIQISQVAQDKGCEKQVIKIFYIMRGGNLSTQMSVSI